MLTPPLDPRPCSLLSQDFLESKTSTLPQSPTPQSQHSSVDIKYTPPSLPSLKPQTFRSRQAQPTSTDSLLSSKIKQSLPLSLISDTQHDIDANLSPLFLSPRVQSYKSLQDQVCSTSEDPFSGRSLSTNPRQWKTSSKKTLSLGGCSPPKDLSSEEITPEAQPIQKSISRLWQESSSSSDHLGKVQKPLLSNRSIPKVQSSCRKLANAKDHEGKIALHRAVIDGSNDEVDRLIEQGASVNVQDNGGNTPLHFAAMRGDIKIAEILLKHGAKGDIANADLELAFDLAIGNGQDNFIRFFLQVLPKANEELLPKDIEGYYCKRLLEAKKEEQIEEQVLFLQHLSCLYVGKKDLITASKILNGALAILEKSPNRLWDFEKYLLNRLAQIEAMFLQNNGISYKCDQPLAYYRNRLKAIRKWSQEDSESWMAWKFIQKTLGNLTQEFKTLLSTLIADAQQILGPPPVKWACLGMGSMSRDEMCPYSDVEFAFLLEQATPEAMDYFGALSQFLGLRIINLGETEYPIFGDKFPSPTPNGFCMDTGGNTPLGVTGVYELIGTPKTLARFQEIKWMDRSIILPNAMSHVCFVAGEERLISSYNEEKKKVQDLIDKKAKSKDKNYKVLALRLLEGHVKEFSPNLTKEKEKISAFGIKKELYRPFQEIIGSLSLFYKLEAKTTSTRIDELAKKGIFTSKGAENLKLVITHVLTLRLRAHLFYQNEEEFLCHPEEGKPLDPHLMYFDMETITILHGIYQILIPFHRCGVEFLKFQSNQAFTNDFCDESTRDQGSKFLKEQQFAKAQEARQQTVALNPNSIEALLRLGVIEEKMAKPNEALQRYTKALDLAKAEYGTENHAQVATCYNNIGKAYNAIGNYEKAFENCQKGLEIRLKIFLGENHPDVASSYNEIALLHQTYGDYEIALKYYHKALTLELQLLGENHPAVAISYNNIGNLYVNLKDYEKALEYHLKSLEIGLCCLDKNHPSVAKSCNNLGATIYESLEGKKGGDFQQMSSKIKLQVSTICSKIGFDIESFDGYGIALEFLQKALEIRLKVFSEAHPEVANTCSQIGHIYKSREEYDIAFGYYQKALKIRRQSLGENHLRTASSYANIGELFKAKIDYEKAIDYFKRSLELQCMIYKKSHPHLLEDLQKMIFMANKLSQSQLESLKQTYDICEETLGREHELVKEFSQLIPKNLDNMI